LKFESDGGARQLERRPHVRAAQLLSGLNHAKILLSFLVEKKRVAKNWFFLKKNLIKLNLPFGRVWIYSAHTQTYSYPSNFILPISNKERTIVN
jgi:hypothetical protein